MHYSAIHYVNLNVRLSYSYQVASSLLSLSHKITTRNYEMNWAKTKQDAQLSQRDRAAGCII